MIDHYLMYQILSLCGAFFWSLTYVLIIIQSYKDKTYGMPLAAICGNISWEIIFSFLYPVDSFQIYINRTWLFLDFVILYQLLKYGRYHYSGILHKWFFFIIFLTLFLFSAFFIIIVVATGNHSGEYTSYIQNIIMSFLFILMLKKRNCLAGQSVYIAASKMIGTFFISMLFFMYPVRKGGSSLMNFAFIVCFVLDLYYLYLVYKLNPNRSN